MKRIKVCTPYVDATSGQRHDGSPQAGEGRYWRIEITVDDNVTPANNPDLASIIAAAKQMIEAEYGTPGVVMETMGN